MVNHNLCVFWMPHDCAFNSLLMIIFDSLLQVPTFSFLRILLIISVGNAASLCSGLNPEILRCASFFLPLFNGFVFCMKIP